MRVMSADWTTCRVVRDCDGDLWFRGCDSDDLWTANTNYPDVFLTADELHTAFGGLTPVLDADGQPVVRTVGDLTARHLGRRVRVDGWGETVFREVFPTQHGGRCMFADGDHEFAATIDIPCEVLP